LLISKGLLAFEPFLATTFDFKHLYLLFL